MVAFRVFSTLTSQWVHAMIQVRINVETNVISQRAHCIYTTSHHCQSERHIPAGILHLYNIASTSKQTLYPSGHIAFIQSCINVEANVISQRAHCIYTTSHQRRSKHHIPAGTLHLYKVASMSKQTSYPSGHIAFIQPCINVSATAYITSCRHGLHQHLCDVVNMLRARNGIYRSLNVDAISWRCIDVDATLYRYVNNGYMDEAPRHISHIKQ